MKKTISILLTLVFLLFGARVEGNTEATTQTGENSGMKEISIKDINGFRIGNATDLENGTGVTVIICEQGAKAGIDIRGGGPAIREGGLFLPSTASDVVHGMVLGGGSTFGLDACGGVQKYLEEREIGFRFLGLTVPLVAQLDIFDLLCGNSKVRPDGQMGYDACIGAYQDNYEDGCVGGGTGATVGKIYGTEFATKTGVGSYAVQLGDLQMGAIVVVNSFGNVLDEDGNIIAGLINPEGTGFLDADKAFLETYATAENAGFTGNTTIGTILTNANFEKNEMTKLAAMAQNGMVRAISPVNTTKDGDAITALSVGGVNVDVDIAGTLAAHVLHKAIENAVYSATSGYGYKAARDILTDSPFTSIE